MLDRDGSTTPENPYILEPYDTDYIQEIVDQDTGEQLIFFSTVEPAVHTQECSFRCHASKAIRLLHHLWHGARVHRRVPAETQTPYDKGLPESAEENHQRQEIEKLELDQSRNYIH